MSDAAEQFPRAVRRSPVRSQLQAAGLMLRESDSVEYSEGGKQGQSFTLNDLSTCDRVGFKGAGCRAWLEAQRISVPCVANRFIEQTDAADVTIVASYSDTEFAIAGFDALHSCRVDELRTAHAQAHPPGCYLVPRAESQAAFGLAGSRVLDALGRLCALDLRPGAFPPGALVQTLCAGVSVQILNRTRESGLRAILLCDVSYGSHMWCSLLQAASDLGGSIAGQSPSYGGEKETQRTDSSERQVGQ